jgi:ribosomal 30S subunit maturation factor RimM
VPGTKALFEKLNWVYVRMREPDMAPMRCKIAAVRQDVDGYILTLTPGVTRDQVAQMKGAELTVESKEMDVIVPTDSFDFSDLPDLEGFEVVDRAGNPIGVVSALYATGMNAAIEIARPEQNAVLVPVIPEVIAGIDVDNGRLLLNNWMPYAVVDEGAAEPETAEDDAD